MIQGEKAREELLVQVKALEAAGKTAVVRSCSDVLDTYNKWHELGGAFMAEGENRRKDFHIHIGLADTD